MSSGFFALLDDIAMLAKAAAASVDDVALGAMKAGSKSVGVIVDDTAVTPQYVQGISPKRELPIVWRISRGSLINKFALIIPAILILTWLAPWALPWLLIIGGSYLVYEGAEKFLAWFGVHNDHHSEKTESEQVEEITGKTESELRREKKIVKSAVTTDLVLSTEIMLVSLSSIEETDFWIRLGILCVIGLVMTFMVYGAVGLLVKLDDIGLHSALNSKFPKFMRRMGFGLAKGMPNVFKVLSAVGTVAMLWVGGHILISALNDVGVPFFYGILHHLSTLVDNAGGFVVWVVDTFVSMIFGLVVGLLYVGVLTAASALLSRPRKTNKVRNT